MTRDDIIRLAHKAGLHLATENHWMPIIDLSYAEQFAALVAAAEREAIIDIVAMHGGSVEIEAAIRAREER